MAAVEEYLAGLPVKYRVVTWADLPAEMGNIVVIIEKE
jgi:hypothetical protein